MRLKWFVPFFWILGFFALAAIAGVFLAHPAVIGWAIMEVAAIWLYLKLLPEEPRPPLTNEEKKDASAKIDAITKHVISKASSSLEDLGLSCRRCGSLALPIIDSGNRYRCSGCGRQFAGAGHCVNEGFFEGLLEEVQQEISHELKHEEVLSLVPLNLEGLSKAAMAQATEKSHRVQRQ